LSIHNLCVIYPDEIAIFHVILNSVLTWGFRRIYPNLYLRISPASF